MGMNTHIDFDHWLGSQIGYELMSAAEDLKYLQLIGVLKPEFSQDGNQFCFLYGDMPNDCVVGFGDTAALAMRDFYSNFYNKKAIVIKPKISTP